MRVKNFNSRLIKLQIAALYFTLIYLLFLTYQVSSWRIDTTHDGYVYLSAYLGTFGIYPPQTANHHGIVAPFFESLIMNLSSSTFVATRYIGFVLIWLTALMIYKIIALRCKKLTAGLFSMLWVSADPAWSRPVDQKYLHIQPTWPNLWIQLLTLISLYLILKNNSLKNINQITLGVIVATLPFIRIQGIISSCIIFFLVLARIKNSRKRFIFTILGVAGFWLNLIQANGGIGKYFENIILNPVTVDDYSPWRSLNAVFLTFIHRGNYYLVLFLLVISIVLLVPQVSVDKNFNAKLKLRFIIAMIITGLMLLLIGRNQNSWLNSFYGNVRFLVIDLAVPIAIVFTTIFIWKITSGNISKTSEIESVLIICAIMVITSAGYQFPLADNGHKWWSTAISVIFLAFFLEYFKKTKQISGIKLPLKSTILIFSVASIIFSLHEGVLFQKTPKLEIRDAATNNFSQIKYPYEDTELVNNLLISLKILSNLEKSAIKINYICAEGLYYVRSNGYSPQARLGLNFTSKYDENYSVNFFCDSSLNKLPKSEGLKLITVGDKLRNVFIVQNDNIEVINSIERWIKS